MIAELARRWGTRFDAIVDVGHLAWMRVALGPIALLHLAPFLRLDATTYRESFHLPYVGWYPELPEPAYVALLWLAAAAAVLLTVGLWSRPAAAVTAGVVAYNLFVSQTHYSNNRAFLLILLLGAAALPVGGAPSVDAWRARRHRSPGPDTTTRAWVVDLLRFEVAAVYLASGTSKLLDPDWWGGTVLALRVERGVEEAVAAGVPRSVVELLADPTTMWWGAKVVVLTELFIGLGLWFPPTRRAAVLLAVLFHVAIQVTADVEVFTWAALAALALWVPTPAIDAPDPPARRWPARSSPRPAPA